MLKIIKNFAEGFIVAFMYMSVSIAFIGLVILLIVTVYEKFSGIGVLFAVVVIISTIVGILRAKDKFRYH